jgi:choline-sulfatase
VKYADKRIGLFLEYLKEKGLYDDMLIVLVSDHGEEHWDHDGFEHGHTMYSELLQVPLIIKLLGNGTVGVRKEMVGTQNLLPTILDVCGVEYDGSEIQATSLRPLLDGSGKFVSQPVFSAFPLYFERGEAVTTEKWKYILSYVSQREELYDLEADPGEQRNLYHERPDALQMMRDVFKEKRAAIRAFKIPERGEEEVKVEYDESTKENLRAIGYLD